MLGLEGATLGTNRLIRRIGGGGMGDVYLAEQAPLGRRVAVKVIRAEGGPVMTDAARERAARIFAREAQTIASLDHPHILPLYDSGEQDGLHYLVAPYIEDGSLADLLAPGAPNRLALPLDPALVARIVAQAAEALHYAHERGVIHRDIKPHNILVRREDMAASPPPPAPVHVYLTDFGVARFLNEVSTRTGASGTPQYSAPEQFRGAPVPATDQYGLACVAYLLLTGRAPFEGAIVELYHQHLTVEPERPSALNPVLPPGVDGVLARALAKDADARYPTIAAFAEALGAALAPAPAAQIVTSWPRPAMTVAGAQTPSAGIDAPHADMVALPPLPTSPTPTPPATPPAGAFAGMGIAMTPPLPAPPPASPPLLAPGDPLGVARTPAPSGASTEPDGTPALRGARTPTSPATPATPPAPPWPGAAQQAAPAGQMDGRAGRLPGGRAAQRRRLALAAVGAMLLVAISVGVLLGPALRVGGASSGNGIGGNAHGNGGVGFVSGSPATGTTGQPGSGAPATPTGTRPAGRGNPGATATPGGSGGGAPPPGATATATDAPPSPPGTPVPPPPTPTPFPTPINGFQQFVSTRSFYGFDFPSSWSANPWPSGSDNEDAFYPSANMPYFNVHYYTSNPPFPTPSAIAAQGSYYFGYSPVSLVGSTNQSVGGVSCVRDDYAWTGEYGDQHHGVVLGCQSPAGRLYALVYNSDAASWPNGDSSYLEPMLRTIWWM